MIRSITNVGGLLEQDGLSGPLKVPSADSIRLYPTLSLKEGYALSI